MDDLSDRVEEVWPSGGIRDLPENWSALAVPAIRDIEVQWRERKERLKGSEELQTFTERLHREWAIETGQIENLYDIERGVTQTLIEQGFDAALMPHGSVNKEPDYIKALLEDQQAALEGLFSFVRQDRPLSTSYIKELQAAMCRSQTTVEVVDQTGRRFHTELLKGEYKRLPNYPKRGDTIYHYCPPEQTASEMDRLVEMHLAHQTQNIAPEVEAAWLHHRFAQIHPFQDGNGRVARALASLVLIRAGLFPMVVGRDDKAIYIESLERADHDDMKSLILLIAREQQNRFARAMSIAAKMDGPSETVQEAARKYAHAVGHSEVARAAAAEELVNEINTIIMSVLQESVSELSAILQKTDPFAKAWLSEPATFEASANLHNELKGYVSGGIGRPSMFSTLTMETGKTKQVATVVLASEETTGDPRVVTFVFAESGEAVRLLVEPSHWHKSHLTMDMDAVRDWGRSALTKTLDALRSRLP